MGKADEHAVAVTSGSRSSRDRREERAHGPKNSCSVNLTPFTSTRILAEVDFTIQTTTELGTEELDVRSMRLGLERPLASQNSAEVKEIWFSIELSDRFSYVLRFDDATV